MLGEVVHRVLICLFLKVADQVSQEDADQTRPKLDSAHMLATYRAPARTIAHAVISKKTSDPNVCSTAGPSWIMAIMFMPM